MAPLKAERFMDMHLFVLFPEESEQMIRMQKAKDKMIYVKGGVPEEELL
jgi:hypothetical protein